MRGFKKWFYPLLPAVIGIAIASCRNTPDVNALPEQTKFAAPDTMPLKLSAPQKINLNAIKSVPVHPEVKPFDMDKLPVHSYDSGAYTPVKYKPAEAKFDLNALPSKDLDIDKLPAKPFKFKTYKLSAPKLIRAGTRRLVNGKMSVYELGAAQGLKADTVALTFTDRDGFVWICTDRGLYRYDGENFWLFDDLPEKRNVFCMLQDGEGQLWMGTFRGAIQVIDIKKGIVKTLDKKAGLSQNNVNRMLIDDRQRIWAATWAGGVNIIDPKAKTIKWLNEKEGLSSKFSPGITQDADHNIWIASNGYGLNFIDLKNKKIRYVDSLHGLKTNIVNSILCDRKGRIWLSQFTGAISMIDAQKTYIQTISEPSNYINVIFTLFEDMRGRIWAGRMGNGVEIINPEQQTRVYLTNSDVINSRYIAGISGDKHGQVWVAELGNLNVIETGKIILDQLGNTPTTSLWEDYKGLIWRASDYNGVTIIDRQKKTIRILNSSSGLGNDSLGFLRENNGKMFITDLANLYIIDSLRHTMTVIGKKQGFISPVRSLAVDKKRNIWLGGQFTGIDVYYPDSKTVKHLGKAEGIRDGDIEDMCADNAGHIWISTFNKGVGIIDIDNGTIQYIDNAQFTDTDQRMMLPDKKGNIWLATKDGLLYVNLVKKTLTSFTARQGLIDKRVTSILKHNNHIYAGSPNGVTVITPSATGVNNKKWQFQTFGAFYGLSKKNPDPESDLVTKDGLYWMGDFGVTVFDLSVRDTNHYPVYITGLNIVDKPRFFTGDAPVKASGMGWDSVAGPANIPVNLRVTYDQNFFQFHYGVVNPARHDTVWYKHRLIGADKDWSETTSATSTPNYINLTPGGYTFEVTALRYDRTWSKPAILSFTINPPWWQTWWAYILYVVSLAGSIWGFSHYRSLQLIKDKRILEHKVHIRTEEVLQQKEEIETQRDDLEKAFSELKTTQTQLIQSEKMASLGELTAGIAHEIQNPLNFVNNFSDVNREMIDELKQELKGGNIDEAISIAEDLQQNEEKINHHGKRADAIVKGMLQHSQSGSGAKEPTNINALADEYMRLAYHGLRAKDKAFNAELVTHFDEKVPKVNVIPQDIGRVLLNLFNNAFYAVNQKQKAAGVDYKPEVSVSTSSGNGQVIIKVKDNGTGISNAIKDKIMQPFFTTKPTGEGTGLGLSLTYDMVVKGHGGSIHVNSTEDEGSEFIISLPLNQMS